MKMRHKVWKKWFSAKTSGKKNGFATRKKMIFLQKKGRKKSKNKNNGGFLAVFPPIRYESTMNVGFRASCNRRTFAPQFKTNKLLKTKGSYEKGIMDYDGCVADHDVVQQQ